MEQAETNLERELQELKQSFAADLAGAATSDALEALKVKYLGRKGSVQQLMQLLKNAPAEERPQLGKLINEVKVAITAECAEAAEQLLQQEESTRLTEETVDVTLPGRRNRRGGIHLLSQVMERVTTVLADMGFSIQVGPDIESDYHNFEALNFAKDHPARDMQDTFYITDDMLLRTQMTDLQPRVMEKHRPPIRVMAPGKCYRNEEVNARSHVFFHQVDVFYIDEGVTFGDLMATKEEFLRRMFPEGTKWRFRPSYFPFVEPGMETDISCFLCDSRGCGVCKYTGWLEISGSGMIHPEVLKNGGIDPEKYTGFAWGMGLERLVMLMYGIPDIRIFTENDTRFLRQFA